MRSLGPSELMEAWERAQARSPVERPVALLATLDRTVAWEAWAQLPLGRRDEQLLAWREQTFGPVLNCLAECPHCQTAVEFSVQTDEIRLPIPEDHAPLSLNRAGMTIHFRLPNSTDLVAATAGHTIAAARRQLFARCLLSATSDEGNHIPPNDVPDDLVGAAAERMLEADPQAELKFDLQCPKCAAHWDAPFDLATFFWLELQTWSKRLLLEIHQLASAYGWSESELLALSPARRQAYLELVRP